MDLITYQHFQTIRLKHFYTGPDYLEVENYDYLGERWIGELFGFNTFLRPYDDPEATRSISLDFTKQDGEMANKVLTTIGLPVNQSFREPDLTNLFGEPHKKIRLAKDTVTLDYFIGKEYPYYISCTLHHQGGIMYLDIMNDSKLLQKLRKKSK